jgi:hypothetical protein
MSNSGNDRKRELECLRRRSRRGSRLRGPRGWRCGRSCCRFGVSSGRFCTVDGHRHARKHGRVETGPRSARPLAAYKDTGGIWAGAAPTLRASVELLLCRKALSDCGTRRGIAFAGRFPVVKLDRNSHPERPRELFCSDLTPIMRSNSSIGIPLTLRGRPSFARMCPDNWTLST